MARPPPPAFPGSVAIDAYGGRSLAQVASTPTTRATFVRQIVTQNPDIFLFDLGTNCYGGPGFGEQSAADFGTNYAAVLDDLHTALPSLIIIAKRPTPRTSEAANNYGNTLPQYRSQIQTACAARSNYCTYIDGNAVPGWSNGTDLFDTVHPNDSGHTKIFNCVKTIFRL